MTAGRAVRSPLTREQQALVESAREIVEGIARSTRARCGRALRQDELEAAGQLGLVEAAQSYDASLGVPFEAFARQRVGGAMLNAIKRARPHLRGRAAVS